MSRDILERHQQEGDISCSEAGYFCNICSAALGLLPLPHLQGANHTNAVFLLTLSQPSRYWARYRDVPERIRTALEKGEIVVKNKKVMCTICDVSLSKEKTVNDHLLSSIHATKVADRSPRSTPPLVTDESALGQEPPSTTLDRIDSTVARALKDGHIKMVQMNGIYGFTCNVCGSTNVITGDTPMRQHLVGRTHLKNERKGELRLLQPRPTSEEPIALPQPPSRIVDRAGRGQPTSPYKIESSPRGIVIIFNYYFEGQGKNQRDGAAADYRNLSDVFTKMDYEVWPENIDLTKQDTLDELDKIRSSQRLGMVDSLIIFFLSHGGDSPDAFRTVDGEIITVEEVIYTKFTDVKCPQLRRKPKLFFFNFCRGKTEQLQSDSWKPNTAFEIAPKHVAVVQAALPHFAAKRHPQTGSVFVDCLCEVLSSYATNLDFHDIVHNTSGLMQERGGTTATPWYIDFGKFFFL